MQVVGVMAKGFCNITDLVAGRKCRNAICCIFTL